MNVKQISKISLLFLVVAFYSQNLLAQAKIDSKIDANQIVIGDQVRIFIELQAAPNDKVQWLKFSDTFDHLEIVEKGKIDTIKQSALWLYKQRLLITGFDSGAFTIPQFYAVVTSVNGQTDTIRTHNFQVVVNTPQVDTSKPFKDIKTIALVTTSWKDYLTLILAIVVGLAILVWVVFYFIKNKKNKVASTPIAQETLVAYTLRLLQELETKELWETGKVKEYYTELSLIIRQYIEQRFNTPAMELTTEELLRKAKKQKEMSAYRKDLKPLLEAADMAKFAKANPLPEEHKMAMQLAKKFIQNSEPKADNTIQNQKA